MSVGCCAFEIGSGSGFNIECSKYFILTVPDLKVMCRNYEGFRVKFLETVQDEVPVLIDFGDKDYVWHIFGQHYPFPLGIDWGTKRLLTFSNGYCLGESSVLVNKYGVRNLVDRIVHIISIWKPPCVVVENNCGVGSIPCEDAVGAKILQKVCQRLGRLNIGVVSINNGYASTRICSNCGKKHTVIKSWYNCPRCGQRINRDLNAAINLSQAVYNKRNIDLSTWRKIRVDKKKERIFIAT